MRASEEEGEIGERTRSRELRMGYRVSSLIDDSREIKLTIRESEDIEQIDIDRTARENRTMSVMSDRE